MGEAYQLLAGKFLSSYFCPTSCSSNPSVHACVYMGIDDKDDLDKDDLSALRPPKLYLYRVAGIWFHTSKCREDANFLRCPKD